MNHIILVVDDDVAIRNLFTALLRGAGYDTEAVGDGGKALTYLRTHPVPALILLHLAMPLMGGREFRRRQLLEPALSAVPVLLVSGDADVAVAAAELGVLGFLRKPCAAPILLAAVTRHAGRGRPAGQT
jgi:CheY-like chemotaxis protein